MNPNTIPSTMTVERAGYGLHTLINNTPAVALPLKAVDARFEVSGDCAQVSLEQIYEFEGVNPVDVVYTFPLPSGASVHQCSMSIDGRKVIAIVKPLEEARIEFRQAKQDGKRALLVETVRENLFELQLGNVQPGDSITVAISYVEPLAIEGKQRRLRIPVCPGVRFIPGRPIGIDGGTDIVPDAGRLNPIRINDRHRDAATFFCAGTIIGATGIESPTHIVEILEADTDMRVPVLFNDDSDVPDRDFILTWQAEDTVLALVSRDDDEYLLCSVRAPDDFPVGRAARDIFFLLDSSSSMIGQNWNALVEAIELALSELSPNDRFSIHLFSNSMKSLTPGLQEATESETSRAIDQLRAHSPNGGTQFTNAFSTIIIAAKDARNPVIVVATDGQFGDEARACSIASRCGIEVHTVGIDANVNDAVLEKIARRTRGTCLLSAPGEDLDQKIHQLVANLLSPAMHQISAGPEWSLVGNPPPLHQGQSALIPFRRTTGEQKTQVRPNISVEMNFTDGSKQEKILGILATKGKSPAILAAKSEITAALDEGNNPRAVDLACRFNVICEGAAFVAVDKAGRVPVAAVTMEQPSLDPSLYEPVLKASFDTPLIAEMTRSCLSQPCHNYSDDDFYSASPESPPSYGRARSQPSGSPNKVPFSSAWLLNAAKITCFDPSQWNKLVTQSLIPWAQESPANVRMFERLLRELLKISLTNGDPIKIAESFALIIAFLPKEAKIESRKLLRTLKI